MVTTQLHLPFKPTPDELFRALIQDFSSIKTIQPHCLPHLNSSSIQLLRHLQSIFTPPLQHNTTLPRVAATSPSNPPIATPLPRVMLHPKHLPLPQPQSTSSLPRVPQHHQPYALPRLQPSPSLNAVLDPVTGKLLEYRHLLKTKQQPSWENACSKEWARLCNGRSKDSTPGTNTIQWINANEIPHHKRPTYVRVCANYRPQKNDPYRVHYTLGGNLIIYPGPKAALTASFPLVKLLLNSVLSTPNTKFHTIDIEDFLVLYPF